VDPSYLLHLYTPHYQPKELIISSIAGSGTALVTQNYVDTAISNTHKVSVLTSVTSGSYGTVDLSTHHVYFFANDSYLPGTSTQLTCTVATSPTPANGHRIFIAWSKRGNSNNASIALDFGSAIVQGPAGNNRFINFTGLHASCILYHTTTTNSGSQWYLHETHSNLSVS